MSMNNRVHIFPGSKGIAGIISEKPFACPKGIALWIQYRACDPDGFILPPEFTEGVFDENMAVYFDHRATCEDCNEISCGSR